MLKLNRGDLTPGQETLMKCVYSDDRAPLVIWTGAIRSGKGVGAALALITMAVDNAVNRGVDNAVYIAAGNTVGSFLNNNQSYLYDAAEHLGVAISYHGGRNEFTLPQIGASIKVYGGGNRGSFHTLRGLTAHSAWIDEATLVDKQFFTTALQRCSFDDSVVIATTNADAPQHFLRTEHIIPIQDAKRAGMLIESDFNENLYYPQQRREELLSINPNTTDYQRALQNRWVQGEGLIIAYDEALHSTDLRLPHMNGVVALDDGTAGVTAALLFQPIPQTRAWMVRDEYYHDGGRLGRKTLAAHLNAIRTRWGVQRLVVDPAAAGMKAEATALGMMPLNANNDFLSGVACVNNALYAGALTIHNDCINLKLELGGYIWNASGNAPIIGAPDHAADALRYGCMNILPFHAAILMNTGRGNDDRQRRFGE